MGSSDVLSLPEAQLTAVAWWVGRMAGHLVPSGGDPRGQAGRASFEQALIGLAKAAEPEALKGGAFSVEVEVWPLPVRLECSPRNWFQEASIQAGLHLLRHPRSFVSVSIAPDGSIVEEWRGRGIRQALIYQNGQPTEFGQLAVEDLCEVLSHTPSRLPRVVSAVSDLDVPARLAPRLQRAVA
jgi:hypothetical protein